MKAEQSVASDQMIREADCWSKVSANLLQKEKPGHIVTNCSLGRLWEKGYGRMTATRGKPLFRLQAVQETSPKTGANRSQINAEKAHNFYIFTALNSGSSDWGGPWEVPGHFNGQRSVKKQRSFQTLSVITRFRHFKVEGSETRYHVSKIYSCHRQPVQV